VHRIPVGLEGSEMYKFQNSVPRLPIPKLEQTVQKYLLEVQPLVPSEEFLEIEKYAKEFLISGNHHFRFVTKNRGSKIATRTIIFG
jgi:hypothetical protein